MTTINKGYKEFTLDNGLFVALQNIPTQIISGRLRVHHGALHELPGEEGLAHFLEHTIMMGGSQKYSPKAVKQVMGTLGYLNASTSSSETTFPVDMLAEDVELYLDFISDIVSCPGFDERSVEEERQRVLREIADNKSGPDFQEDIMFFDALFGPNSPHNYNVLGKEDVIAKATPNDLQKLHERGYHATNMDLILVGGLPGNIEELIKEKFSAISAGVNSRFVFPRNSSLEKSTIIENSAPELYNPENPAESSARFQLAFPASTYGDPEHYPVMMLADVLCRSSNSYLFQRLSRDMGLAYGIGGGYHFDNNKGLVLVTGKIDASRIGQALGAIFEEMKELQENIIPKHLLHLLIKQSKYSIAKVFESNAGHISAIQSKLDYGFTPELYFREIDAVTPEQIREVANKYLPSSREEGKYVLLLRDPLKQ